MIYIKIYEYMVDQDMRNIRMVLNKVSDDYVNKQVKFVIKAKMGRQFREFKYTETINKIEYDKNKNTFQLFFEKEDTYLIIPPKGDITFHERFERIPKRILHKGETLEEIVTKLREI